MTILAGTSVYFTIVYFAQICDLQQSNLLCSKLTISTSVKSCSVDPLNRLQCTLKMYLVVHIWQQTHFILVIVDLWRSWCRAKFDFVEHSWPQNARLKSKIILKSEKTSEQVKIPTNLLYSMSGHPCLHSYWLVRRALRTTIHELLEWCEVVFSISKGTTHHLWAATTTKTTYAQVHPVHTHRSTHNESSQNLAGNLWPDLRS